MSTTTIDSKQATIQLLNAFFNKELAQIERDRSWIKDNVTDADKREKRLSYQDWREQQMLTFIALLGQFN